MTERASFGPGERGARPVSWIALVGLLLAILSAAVLIGAAFGYRYGYWDFRFALLTLSKGAAYGAGAGALISLVGIGHGWPGGLRRGALLGLIGVVVGGGAFYTIGERWFTVKTVPFIHDITTDTANPPPFIAVVPDRVAENANPHDYAGEELALQQRCGYPDLAPLEVNMPPEQAFDEALAVATTMGWQIIASDKAAGRIEATDMSFWYHFIDDIVIRVAPSDDPSLQTRIDMRSLSRKGRSDVGVNAARIRAYMAKLGERFG